MKGLVAEAYQLKLGKNASNMLKGDKAITALTDAMKKGSVKTAELIPFLDALMRRDAAPGLAQARQSSIAGENRFGNEKDRFWDNFQKGGGESGVKKFWDMAAGMMTWFADNGAELGYSFETAIYWLKAFKSGVYELSQFISTGEHNSFTDWARGLGIDVDSIRESFIGLKDATMKLLGVDPEKSIGENLTGITDRLVIFVGDLDKILKSIIVVIEGLAKIRGYFFETQGEKNAKEVAYTKDVSTVGEYDAERNKFFRQWENSPGKGLSDIVGALWGGTADALGGVKGMAFGGQTPSSLPPSIPSWKPDGWGTTASDIGATRRSDYTPQQVNHSVKLEVTGNAEMISALMDEKTRTQLPILLSSEIAKAVVGAPKRD